MQRITARLAPTVFLGALATGCVHVSSTSFESPAPATSPDSVQVFATKVPTQYREIAVLKVRRFLVTDRKTLEALRKEAAELGANGILLVNAPNSGTQRHEGTGVIWSGRKPSVLSTSTVTTIDAFERAVAIRVEKP